MQLKTGETGGRAPSLGTSGRTRAGTLPRVGFLAHAAGPSFVVPKNSSSCETPTPAAMPVPKQIPHHDPRVDHPRIGPFMWYCTCHCLTCVCLVASGRDAKGVWGVSLSLIHPSTRAGREGEHASSRRPSNTPQCKPIFSSYTLRALRQARCCHDRPGPTSRSTSSSPRAVLVGQHASLPTE